MLSYTKEAFWRITLLPSKVMISHSMNLQGLISNQNMILGYPWYVSMSGAKFGTNNPQKIASHKKRTKYLDMFQVCEMGFFHLPCIAVSDFTGERPHVLLKLCKTNITILISSIRLNTFSCLTSTLFPR